MARRHRNEVMAGTFVIAALAAAVSVTVWLGGLNLSGTRVYLRVPLEAGQTGLAEGSAVYLGPSRVGKISDISPAEDWQSFLATIRLDKPVRLYADAVVQSSAPPLGGAATLTVLRLGSPDAGESSPQQPIDLHVGPSPLVRDLQRELGYGAQERTAFQQTLHNINALSGHLSSIGNAWQAELTQGNQDNMLADAKATLSELRELATQLRADARTVLALLGTQLDAQNSDAALAKLHASLDDVNRISTHTAQMVATIRPGVEQTVANLAAAAQQAEAMTRDDLPEMLATLRAGGDELLGVLRDLRGVSGDAREVMAVNRENLHEIIANLTQVSVQLKATSREVRRQPWRLLGKPDVEEVRSQNIQEAARAFADGAAELDSAIQRLAALSRIQGDAIPADDPQLQQVRRQIRDSFGRFMQVEQALYRELLP